MTFEELSNKSVSSLRTLVQIDLGNINIQWVNAGAGIWYVNFTGLYPEVDDSLLDGFTAQLFGDIGSVTVDTTPYTKVASILALASSPISFYYDGVSKVYVHIIDNEDPILHSVFLGVIYGLSYKEFTPLNGNVIYEGRLVSDIPIQQSRDPLYFGKLQYDGADIQIINTDGRFDLSGESLSFFGNQIRVLIGYDELDIDDYIQIYNGVVEAVTISESFMALSFVDARKVLTKKTSYECDGINALDAIVAILADAYGIPYSTDYFDTTEWDAATLLVDNVTINNDPDDLPQVVDLIELICKSVFGEFIINADGKYTFKVIDTSASALTTISKYDISNEISITYDPAEVLSSIRVGYARYLNQDSNNSIIWLTDTSHETVVYTKYRVYNEVDFETVLPDQTSAQALADVIMAYSKDIHGKIIITVPMKYYLYNVIDNIDVELNRIASTMIGTKKCEILSKTYHLIDQTIDFEVRIV